MLTLARPVPNDIAEMVRCMAVMVNPDRLRSVHHERQITRRWIGADRLRRALKLDRAGFERVATEAESAGFIRLGVGPKDDDRIALERLAVGVFGLTTLSARKTRPFPDLLLGIDHADLLATIANFADSSPLVEAVAHALGRDVEATWDEMTRAERLGLVATWPDHPSGPSVALSPYVAGLIGLALSDDGSRWLDPGEADSTWTLDDDGIASETDCSSPDSAGIFSEMADRDSPDGHLVAATGELADAILDRLRAEEDQASECRGHVAALRESGQYDRLTRAERRRLDIEGTGGAMSEIRTKLPQPQTLYAVRSIWPIRIEYRGNPRRWTPEHGPCPECSGKPFSLVAYCILCDRSGLDRVLPAVEPEMVPDPESKRFYPPKKSDGGSRPGYPTKWADSPAKAETRQPRSSRTRAARRPTAKAERSPAPLKGGLG